MTFEKFYWCNKERRGTFKGISSKFSAVHWHCSLTSAVNIRNTDCKEQRPTPVMGNGTDFPGSYQPFYSLEAA